MGVCLIVQLEDGDSITEPNQDVFFENTDGANKIVKLFRLQAKVAGTHRAIRVPWVCSLRTQIEQRILNNNPNRTNSS